MSRKHKTSVDWKELYGTLLPNEPDIFVDHSKMKHYQKLAQGSSAMSSLTTSAYFFKKMPCNYRYSITESFFKDQQQGIN